MIGHQQIIRARQQGKKPSLVLVEYGEEPPKAEWDFQHPEKQLLYGLHPTVYIREGLVPDTRFLSGCKVAFNCNRITREAKETVQKIISYQPEMLLFMDRKTQQLGMWRNGKWET
ncbi:hypothetical protein NB640_11075 [Oxalobacter vibrioformis]|uniref:Uncharacterized protein n=1 Tax=Oxalobacter vibrioformis TaxID=933080 RepID=A0A9E9LVS2_9BURK|nr:hypothetical protein [Oxalobacter vibrioformis]WAW09754.1 hypothetical protein NB640_11075 [Oxalobacter vibrioformis]